MPLHEFDSAQAAAPPAVAARTQRLRACATRAAGCACCGVARRLLWLCFAAVRHGDTAIAEMLAAEAEHYVDAGAHQGGCPQVPRPAGLRGGRTPAQGRVPGPAGHPGVLVAATDAGWKRGTCGLGYVIDDGRWGMHGWKFGPQDPTGPAKVLVSELRAVGLLLDRIDDDGADLVLLLDSLQALRFLSAWQGGDTGRMPDGYDLRPRRYGAAPSLVRLAARVARMPGLRLEHVKGHSGHPLNEAADSLASIARRRVTEVFDSPARAAGLVEAFLRAWHTPALAA
ncbi:hypothetical protein F8568_016440 [Actinomadura sp. LD22]|uniref:RNase H type-1 domain-containing protein n=1 Tax=Actinomadura physcomitrii TaxID=2650748 RepID=A0A6I4M8C4_9ACTN|nr:RNase H family protein [Actinomadura physcomitrii]MWA01932.1 hypothetical protein [Actinomadura physcomitrii]